MCCAENSAQKSLDNKWRAKIGERNSAQKTKQEIARKKIGERNSAQKFYTRKSSNSLIVRLMSWRICACKIFKKEIARKK